GHNPGFAPPPPKVLFLSPRETSTVFAAAHEIFLRVRKTQQYTSWRLGSPANWRTVLSSLVIVFGLSRKSLTIHFKKMQHPTLEHVFSFKDK
ncbi:unnamed protein product, partial [Mycena citricolor]